MKIDQIINFLPKIDEQGLTDILNVIDQSKQFNNFRNVGSADNLFELEYAKYLGTKNQNFLSIYKQIVIEACYAEFLEWYEYLTKNILRSDVQNLLGINFDHSNNDWLAEFKSSKLIGWAYKLEDISVFENNIDKVYELGKLMINFFNSRKPVSTLDDDYFESDHAQLVLDSIRKIIIEDDTKELTSHLESDKLLCMIEVYGWDNRFNPILLEWIYKNKEVVESWN